MAETNWQPMEVQEATPSILAERRRQGERMAKDMLGKAIPADVVNKALKSILNDEVWLNNIYQANVRRRVGPGWFDETEEVWNAFPEEWGEVIWISLKRRDREPVRDWRHMQKIKNDICGPESEGFELYPAESRLVDTANQYHIFVVSQRMPVGFQYRAVRGPENSIAGSKQREV